ncbi:MAG: TIGR04283 family arsenosugar biosynthesis glycosyltransferase [Planctomycetota bacterium]|jgi:rSAM/selenodomain-associated transferase 2/rSAM/selenodomain-associated transferase 1
MATDAPSTASAAGIAGSEGGRIGVVIPALNEAAHLGATIATCLAELGACEIVVADGGSRDETRAIAESAGARWVRCLPGRAVQCNAGAAALPDAAILLFLHADTQLPKDAGAIIRAVLARPQTAAGVFRLRFDASGFGYRFTEFCQFLRSLLLGRPSGDQGLYCTRAAFEAAGGYPCVPVFEDLEFALRLQRHGRLQHAWAPAVTSARRYQAEGVWTRAFKNWRLRHSHRMGTPHAELAARYAEGGGRTPPTDEVVAIMGRAPELGAVKSRLAASVGEAAALAVHTALGQAVAAALTPSEGAERTAWAVVTPDEKLSEAAEWLGTGWRTHPQGEGDLGARMFRVVESAFACGARRVVLFGTDCAEVRPSDCDAAFEALKQNDAVMGPAEDGGYWCIGMSKPLPALFRNIAWGTGSVARLTRERAEAEGISLAELRTLSDVDRKDDLDALIARLRSTGDGADTALAESLAAAPSK